MFHQLLGRFGIAIVIVAFAWSMAMVLEEVTKGTIVEECTSWINSSDGDRWCAQWTATTSADDPSPWPTVAVVAGAMLWAVTPALPGAPGRAQAGTPSGTR